MKTYYRDQDGYTYYIKDGDLMAWPTFQDGTPDLENEAYVSEFDMPLTPDEEEAIRRHLAE
jgi:hypothetical protein